MAIDQDIQQRVDAYRGNPQALMQRYQQNQQLLDLLALQRLKTEKDEAARKVQMEMQQDPQTIKQQRERQLLDMTKQDLAQQTQGIMQNAQARQQKNMQQVAKQGAASPQQMQRVASGLGALAQRQAPQRMAGGGIVAFETGGGVTQEMIQAYRAQLRKSNPRAAISMSDDRIRKILSEQQAGTTDVPRSEDPNYELTRRGYRQIANAEDPEAQVIETATLEEKAGPGEAVTAASVTETEVAPPTDQVADAAPAQVADSQVQAPSAATNTTTQPETQPQGLMDLIKGMPQTAPQIDLSKVGDAGRGILSGAGISGGNAETARTTARDAAAVYMDRKGKAKTMQDYLAQLKELDVSQTDPKKMRDEQISAFLRGTAGKGSFGMTMAGGSGAMAEEREKQEKSKRDRLLSRLNIEKSAMDMDLDIAKNALADGRSAYEQAMANQRTMAQVMAQTRGQDIQLAIKNAEMEYNTNQNNIKNILDAANIQYTDALRRDMNAADMRQQAGATLGKIQVDRAEMFQSMLENDPTYKAATIAANSDKPPENADELVRAAYNAVQTKVNAMFEAAGITATESQLMDIMRGSGGATMPTAATSAGNFNLSQAGQEALTRNLGQ